MPELSELPDQNGFLAVYHDTPERRLARVGATLSRRHERGRSVWEFRLPRSQRPPLELDAPGGPAGPPPQIERLLTAFVRQAELEPALKVRVARRGRRNEIRVLEGQRVLDTFSVKAKNEQSVFLRLLDGAEPAAAVEPVAWLRGVLARQYAEILRHDPGVRLALAPEDLHGLRVAVRRTRSLLRAARPMIIDVAWPEPLRAELKWLGGVLGPGATSTSLSSASAIRSLSSRSRSVVPQARCSIRWKQSGAQRRHRLPKRFPASATSAYSTGSRKQLEDRTAKPATSP